LIKRNL